MNKQLGATLLVAGTSIGVGMLALPISMSGNGFCGSLIIMFFVWSSMLLSALFALEVNLSLPRGANLRSMASTTLGPLGSGVVWVCYLGLLYSLNAAYLDGILAFLRLHFQNFYIYGFLLLLSFMILLVFGNKFIDSLNRILMLMLFLFFVIVILGMTQQVDFGQISYWNLHHASIASSIVVTAFGFQIVIPSIRNYCNEDVDAMVKSILYGASLAFIVYIIWQFGAFINLSAQDLLRIKTTIDPVVTLSQSLFGVNNIYTNSLEWFTIFAISTSFLGVSVSLFDFFMDALNLNSKGCFKLFVLALIFTPSILCLIYFPHIFMQALSYAGLFVVLLLGILPVVMSIIVRKKFKKNMVWRVPYATAGMLWISLVMVFVLTGL